MLVALHLAFERLELNNIEGSEQKFIDHLQALIAKAIGQACERTMVQLSRNEKRNGKRCSPASPARKPCTPYKKQLTCN